MRSVAAIALTLALLPVLAAGAQSSPRAQDASAQADLRGLVSLVGTCYAQFDDYTLCTAARQLTRGGAVKTRLPLVDGLPPARSGKVAVTASSASTYSVDAVSKSGVRYRLRVSADGRVTQSCAPRGRGLCPASGHFDSGALNLVAGQRRHHHALIATSDAQARTAVGTLATLVESCFATTHTYLGCMTVAALTRGGAGAGLPLVDGYPSIGQVAVTASSASGYTIQGLSKSVTVYQLARGPSGISHTCSPVGTASCPATGAW
jgi:hypothetical protein